MDQTSTESNKTRPFMSPTYGDHKLDKSQELNASMSISPLSPDEVTNKIMSTLSGGES